MSCPDWSRLTADPGTPVPAEAWAHAESCADCRRSALAADPTLVFRRLPRATVTDDDVASMRLAVHAMRRDLARPMPQLDERTFDVPGRRFGGARFATRWAALAAAAVLAILLPIADVAPRRAGEPVAAQADAEGETLPSWLSELLADQPLVEVAGAHDVTQVDTADLSLVVISVDDLEIESLDV